MSDTPRTDAQACHVSVDRAGCIMLSYSKDGGYVPRLLSEQLERENAEQCVLLGKSGERECALLGKVERLERENAELRRDVYQCPPTSENDYEGLTWSDAFEVLERDNTALRESRERLVRTASEVLEAFVLHKKVETGHPCPENMGICIDLRAAIDAARKEAKP